MNSLFKKFFYIAGKAFGKDRYINALFLFIMAIIAIMAIIKPMFISQANYFSMVNQFPEYGLMAFGIMLAMITGGIDLSVVGVANLTSICSALTILRVMPQNSDVQSFPGFALVILIAAAIGFCCGALNGILIAKVKIPPILTTLGTHQLFTGICVIITGGKPISGLPMYYSNMFTYRFLGLFPVSLIIFIAVAFTLHFLLSKTSYGSKIYMLGTNQKAAVFSGINTTKIVIQTYAISGLLAAIAGLVMLANYNSAKPDYGSAYVLQCVLICVLGGINPSGGFGKVLGVTFAIFILQILSSSLNMFTGVSNFYRPLIWGGALLLIMLMNSFLKSPKRNKKIENTPE